MLSIIIPCYQSEAYLKDSLEELQHTFAKKLSRHEVEFIFVDDKSTDNTLELLSKSWLSEKAQILRHKKNEGAHAACLTGLRHARGTCFCFLAADLQDPPEIVWQLYKRIKDTKHTLGVGMRLSRPERGLSVLGSKLFHSLMRLFLPAAPRGGFDVVIFDREVRKYLLENDHPYAHLLYQPFHLKLSLCVLPYARRERKKGRSSWTFQKKAKLFLRSLAYHGQKALRSRFFTSQSS
jgi:dolichol-phosphate mannosyltransferase